MTNQIPEVPNVGVMSQEQYEDLVWRLERASQAPVHFQERGKPPMPYPLERRPANPGYIPEPAGPENGSAPRPRFSLWSVQVPLPVLGMGILGGLAGGGLAAALLIPNVHAHQLSQETQRADQAEQETQVAGDAITNACVLLQNSLPKDFKASPPAAASSSPPAPTSAGLGE